MLKHSLSIMTMVNQMRNVLRDDFWMNGFDYGTQLALACYDFIQNRLTQEDLRVASKKDIQFYSNVVETMLDSVTVGKSSEGKIEIVYQISESLELELALKCLKSPVLEKKLIGHSILIS